MAVSVGVHAAPPTTRLVGPDGTTAVAKMAPGGTTTFTVRVDAPTATTIGTAYRLSQISPPPPPDGYFWITGRSVAGSPYSDTSIGGSPDAEVTAAPGNRLAPDNDVNLGASASGLGGVPPATNILATTVTLASDPATPYGTYRIAPMNRASFVTVAGSPATDASMSGAFLDIVIGQMLTVTKNGSGSGTAGSNDSPQSINCPGTCSSVFPGTSVTLTAAPAGGSVFTGWLGSRCTGKAACTVLVDHSTSVSATFALSTIGTHILDVDGNGQYDALTDGLMMLRYMYGLRGDSITSGALGAGATRNTAAIDTYLTDIAPMLDVNGDGSLDGLTDGLIVLRYLFGITGTTLTDGTLTPTSTRTSPSAIAAYLATLRP
jgi:hypothetical protein